MATQFAAVFKGKIGLAFSQQSRCLACIRGLALACLAAPTHRAESTGPAPCRAPAQEHIMPSPVQTLSQRVVRRLCLWGWSGVDEASVCGLGIHTPVGEVPAVWDEALSRLRKEWALGQGGLPSLPQLHSQLLGIQEL